MSSSRDSILARIREALSTPSPHLPATPRRADAEARQWLPAVGEDLVARFAQQAAILKADFVQVADMTAAQVKLREIAEREGWKRAACSETMLLGEIGVALLRVSRGYEVNELEACDAGITECDALVAQTGSVVLTARSGGGRALSVLPPHHVVIARRSQLLPDLPAAYALLHERYGGAWPSLMTFITGPSRTGDIERILVLGAHGPKKLTILMVDDALSAD